MFVVLVLTKSKNISALKLFELSKRGDKLTGTHFPSGVTPSHTSVLLMDLSGLQTCVVMT